MVVSPTIDKYSMCSCCWRKGVTIMSINRHHAKRAKWEERMWEWSEDKEERKSCCHGQQPCSHCSCENNELSWVDVPPSPCIYCILSLSIIKWLSPVDVGGFAETRKILCFSVLALRWAKISTSPVGFPNKEWARESRTLTRGSSACELCGMFTVWLR